MFKINFHISHLSRKDLIKRAYKRFFVSLFFVVLFFGLAGYAAGQLGWLKGEKTDNPVSDSGTADSSVGVSGDNTEQPVVVPTVVPSKKVKNEISNNPPETGAAVSGAEATNPDGSKTGTVAEGEAVSSALSGAANNAGSSSPLGVVYRDETGSNAALESVLKNYLNSLRWKSEITVLKEIVVQDAGASGWAGQWGGTYYMNSFGDITSAYGVIILNVYYYKASPYFNDYMKLVLSHEYGHHYTQYHKWVDGDLPITSRMPESYYSTRPLSKSATTLDCSASWSTCEPEILAEDYSYLYSGYGRQAMAAQFGYPSDPGTRSWLDNIETSVKSSAPIGNDAPAAAPTPTPAVPVEKDEEAPQLEPDTEVPAVSFSKPATNPHSWENGNLIISVLSSDNIGVLKIELFINDELALTVDNTKFSARWDYDSVGPGDYTLTAKAYDAAGNLGIAALLVNKK